MEARSMLRSVLFLIIWGICAGCIQGDRKSPPEKVTLAIATIPDTALVQIALAQGYFREEGLEVTPHLHRYGKLALREVVEGEADFATVAQTPVMFSVLDGKEIAIVSTIMNSSLSHAIVARKDRGIASFKDLRGKRIAATRGTTSEFFLYAVLLTNGVSMKEVEVVDLGTEKHADALARGEVDAASSFLPYSALIEKSLGVNSVMLRDSNVFRISFNVVAAKEYVRKHPETVVKLLKSLIKAEEFARKNPPLAQRIVADTAGLPLEVVRNFWASINLATTLDQTLLLSLEDESEWAIKNRLAPAQRIPNFLNYVYLDALRALKPDAVRILK